MEGSDSQLNNVHNKSIEQAQQQSKPADASLIQSADLIDVSVHVQDGMIRPEHETHIINDLMDTLIKETSTVEYNNLPHIESLVHVETPLTCQDPKMDEKFPEATVVEAPYGKSLKAEERTVNKDSSLGNIDSISKSNETLISAQLDMPEKPEISQFTNEQDILVKNTKTKAETSCVLFSQEDSQTVEVNNPSTEDHKILQKIANNDSVGARVDITQSIGHLTPIPDDRPSTPEQISRPISRASPTHIVADEDKLSKFKALAVKLKKDLAKSKDELQITNNKLVNLSQNFSAMEKENTRMKSLNSQLVNNYNSLQAQHDLILDDYETIKKKFKLHLQQKPDDSIKDLKIQLEKKTNTIYELESKLADIQLQVEQKDQLKSKLRDLTESIQSTEKKYHSTLRELELFRSELSKVSIASSTYKDECNQLRQQVSTMQQTLETERVNHEKLRVSFESKVQCLKQQLKSSEDDLNILNLEFENYKSKVSQVMQDTNLVQASSIRTFEQEKLKQLKTSNEDLRNQITNLKQELKDVNSSKNKLEEKIQELMAIKETKPPHIDRQLEERLERLKIENQQLKLSLEQFETSQPTEHSSISGTKVVAKTETILGHGDLSNLSNLSGDELTKELTSILFQNSNGLPEMIEHTNASLLESRLDPNSLTSTTGDSISFRFGRTEPSYAHVGLPMKGAPVEILGGKSSILNDAHNQIDNLTQAYLESEKTNKLLSDQITALKEEIRRLQRGNERLDLADNLEYLKNIVIKFFSLEGQVEKQRLIPVLSTMLRLSPEEQSKLQSSAQNNDKGGFFRLI